MRLPLFASFAALSALLLTPAAAQRREATPEQRIDRLERQANQLQRRVFGRQPADTAGFIDDPAVTQSQLGTLNSRLDSVERQMTDLIRTTEENSNRVATMEAELARLRADSDSRLRTLETGAAGPPATDATDSTDGGGDDSAGFGAPPPAPRPKVETAEADPIEPPVASARPGDPDFIAAGEEAYDRGYELWLQKRYDQAITALRAMASSFPGHRRVSWAYNLAGRALLDKGEAYAAAEALLANYRRDPAGERAPDSLFYLGQASMRLKQADKACMAYSELQSRYGSNLRAELARQLPAARAEANCS